MKKKLTKAKKPTKVASTATRRGGGKVAPKKKVVTEKPLGRVSHYFDNIKVAAIKLEAPLKKGDTVRIEGGTTVVKMKIASMQKDHKPVLTAKAKDEIGIKVSKKVREGYRVFKA
ncbi:MAG: translation elongation factor-like protein [bacterium]|nr:translation elongation factor-like protein [bacterium]